MPEKNIVIDNGSDVIKAGFAGDNQPSIKFPSIIGYPKKDAINILFRKEYMVNEAI